MSFYGKKAFDREYLNYEIFALFQVLEWNQVGSSKSTQINVNTFFICCQGRLYYSKFCKKAKSFVCFRPGILELWNAFWTYIRNPHNIVDFHGYFFFKLWTFICLCFPDSFMILSHSKSWKIYFLSNFTQKMTKVAFSSRKGPLKLD